jgi:hypothetical protein
LAYHKRLIVALEKLNQLSSEVTRSLTGESANLPSLLCSPCVDFVTEQVHPVLQRAGSELLLVRSIPPDLARSVMASFIGQSIIQQDSPQPCTLCSPGQEGHILRSLQEAKDVGGEYLARENRLATHFRDAGHRSGLVEEDKLIDDELLRLSALSLQIMSHVVSIFERYGLKEAADTARLTDVFQGDYMGYWLFAKGRRQNTDCLNRSTLHQWLDFLSPNLGEDGFHILRSNAPLFALRQRDIIGRTPLDIARIKGLAAACQILVDCEASQTIRNNDEMVPT